FRHAVLLKKVAYATFLKVSEVAAHDAGEGLAVHGAGDGGGAGARRANHAVGGDGGHRRVADAPRGSGGGSADLHLHRRVVHAAEGEVGVVQGQGGGGGARAGAGAGGGQPLAAGGGVVDRDRHVGRAGHGGGDGGGAGLGAVVDHAAVIYRGDVRIAAR